MIFQITLINKLMRLKLIKPIKTIGHKNKTTSLVILKLISNPMTRFQSHKQYPKKGCHNKIQFNINRNQIISTLIQKIK